MKHKPFSSLNIVVVAHTYTTGPPQILRDYLKIRSHNLLYIGHPFSYRKELRSKSNFYHKGRNIRNRTFPGISNSLLLFARDIIATIFFVLSSKCKFDIYIGADCLNAYTGLILKKLGRTNKVICYTMDYAIKRFENPILNHLYHSLDKNVQKNVYSIWNVSDIMFKARISLRKPKKHDAPQFVVPVGVDFSKINRSTSNQVNMNRIAYMGGLHPTFNPQILLEALPQLIERFPDLKLVIIGTGPLENEIRDFIKDKGLENHVTMFGYIEDHSEVERILTGCCIGFALYMPNPHTYKMFTDVSKPKVYMGCGLPVIITSVPPIAREVRKYQTGIVIKYDKEELIDATTKLLSDNEFYKDCRKNAIEYISRFEWTEIFRTAFDTSFN